MPLFRILELQDPKPTNPPGAPALGKGESAMKNLGHMMETLAVETTKMEQEFIWLLTQHKNLIGDLRKLDVIHSPPKSHLQLGNKINELADNATFSLNSSSINLG